MKSLNFRLIVPTKTLSYSFSMVKLYKDYCITIIGTVTVFVHYCIAWYNRYIDLFL